MDIKINSIHFSADQKLEDFINSKMSKLNNYAEGLISSDITLSLEKASGNNFDSKVVKAKVKSRDFEYFAEKKSESFEAATDGVSDALRQQILKRKEKIQKKK